jgi:hypothetical protein
MISVKNVLGIFPGSKVVAKDKPDHCPHCEKEYSGNGGRKKELTEIETQYDSDGNLIERRVRTSKVSAVPKWRRRGKIVLRTWPDGRSEWACHYCGRSVLVVQ